MSWLKRIWEWLRGLFRPEFAQRIQAGLEAAAPYLSRAYEIVSLIAALTPTRTDDEILDAARRLGIVEFLIDPAADRGEILRHLALEALRRIFPQAPERQLNRAIEVAYGAVRP